MKIVSIPIEPLEMRYSKQWNRWFTDAFVECHQISYVIVIDPNPLTTEIRDGAFLDVCGTNFYKAKQLQGICEMIHNGEVDKDTIFFFHDAWFPGVEMLAYMRDGLGIEFKITGCLHAGTYDPTDFISKKGMGMWGRDLEQAWLNIYDQLFVPTQYHKNLIIGARVIDPDIISVSGFPIAVPIVDFGRQKEKIVVFPHRLTEDKQPELFDEVERVLSIFHPDWTFIKTQEIKRSKQEYYDLLRRSSIAVSFAKHENWGIGMQEATLVGCLPVVPDRLSYKEMYHTEFRYSDLSDAIYKLNKMMIAIDSGSVDMYYQIWQYDRDTIVSAGKHAIPNMIGELCGLKDIHR
jgi:hypothetical protein